MKTIFKISLLLLGVALFQAQKSKPLDLSEWNRQVVLDSLLVENSGIQFYNNFIYTFNDSGGKAEVYKVNPETGKIVQTIHLKKTENIDFEDIAFDGKNLYVGDFGDNNGNRSQKYIYSFNLSKIDPNESYVELNPKKHTFTIDEQIQENATEAHTTNFDVEAMIFYNGKLHIFTKEWTHAKTTHFTLEMGYAYQSAKKVESFNTHCLITAADIGGNTLLMTGYTREGEVFLWKFDDFSDGKFFNGKHQRYDLGLSPAIGQIEGVTISEDKFFISGENFSKFGFQCPQKLYTLQWEDLP